MPRYLNPGFKVLKDQLTRFTPRDVVSQQIERAEALLRQVDVGRDYLYPELTRQIIGHPTEQFPQLVVSGQEAFHDLRLLIEDLSKSAPLVDGESGPEVVPLEDVCRQYNVSSKTVQRWRLRGLPARQLVVQKRRRLGFLRTTLDWFVSRFEKEVGRGTRFSVMNEDEKERLIFSARRLAMEGHCQTDVTRVLARQFSRSHETVRYTLRKFDLTHPEVAVFPNVVPPLTESQKDEVYQLFLRGTSIAVLSERFQRAKATIHRVVAEVRARNLLAQEIDYIDSAEFQLPGAAELILGPVPAVRASGPAKAPPGLPPYLASLYATPLLAREEEAYYFRKMNFLKFQAAALLKGLNSNQPRVKEMEQIEALLEQANEVKNFLIRSNLRLVVSVAKKHMRPTSNFFEMVSDGNMSLIKAIEKFDYSRGFKFSTYATWAIMKNYARSIPAETNLKDRFRTGTEEVFQNSTDVRGDQFRDELNNLQQHQVIMEILKQLESRERDIIVARFGLQSGGQPQTLEQVGARLGVTKERIRQLENRALHKMRRIAEIEHLEVPGL